MFDNDHIELLRQVRLALQQDDVETAIQALNQAVDLSLNAEDYGTAGRHLGNLALLYYRQGNSDEALKCFEEALQCARSEKDELTESGLLGNIGNILREAGRHRSAERYLQEAIALSQKIGDTRGRGIWMGNLGLVYDDLDNAQRAIELHTQSVSIARQLQDQRGLMARLTNLANSYMKLGDIVQALPILTEAVSYQLKLGQFEDAIKNLVQLGDVCYDLSKHTQPHQARQYLEQALTMYNQAVELTDAKRNPLFVADVHQKIGNTLYNLEHDSDAITHWGQAITYYDALNMSTQADVLRQNIELVSGEKYT